MPYANIEERRAYHQNWRQKNRPRQRRANLKALYGITPERYDLILAAQNGHCGMCPSTSRLGVDHCHKTGRVRGILCRVCNVHLGGLGDDAEALQRGLKYLETPCP
jgi:hypothetical protein